MSSPSVMTGPSVSQLMEAIRHHPSSSHCVFKYPTATYSVHTGKISFAPGTKFNRQLESRVSGRARATTMNIRPLKEGEKPNLPKFKLPKATSPAFPSSVICADFIKHEHSLEHRHGSEGSSWLNKSKSTENLSRQEFEESTTSNTTSTIVSNDDNNVVVSESGIAGVFSKFPNTKPCKISSTREKSRQASRAAGQSRRPVSGPTSWLPGMPNFKSCEEDMHACHHIYPAMSLQLEGGINHYVETNKKCQGRNVRFSNVNNVNAFEPCLDSSRGSSRRANKKLCSGVRDGESKRNSVCRGFSQNNTVDDVAKHIDRMYYIQSKLKPV